MRNCCSPEWWARSHFAVSEGRHATYAHASCLGQTPDASEGQEQVTEVLRGERVQRA